MKLIELDGWATVEVCPDDDRTKLVVTNERCESISLTMASARKLFGALRQFDNEGLLED